MTAQEVIDSLRPLNPGRRYAVLRGKYTDENGNEIAIAIDRPGGGWDMFAAKYINGQWVECLIPSLQERTDWEEV